MEPSILILSGGLDSAVSAAVAKTQSQPQLALFFDYGQRAASAEFQAAGKLAEYFQVPLEPVALPWLGALGGSALTDKRQALPQLAATELDDDIPTQASAQAVWVPNRNGVFLNVAAAYADKLAATLLVTGFNAEEAATFPDNSLAFVVAAAEFFRYSTQVGAKVISYTQEWNKSEIVIEAIKRALPLELIWSCYEAGSQQCSVCESCLRSIRAYQQAGVWSQVKGRFKHEGKL